jgi:Flp pilus assembly protein TadG
MPLIDTRKNHGSSPRRRLEKGNAMLEFGLAIFMLVPMLFGTVSFGINLGNWLQSTQISRDIAHMYASQVDFSVAQNKNLAVALAQGLSGMTVDSGNGVVILSQIVKVYQTDCDAAGLSGKCTNLGKRVFVNRLTIGNNSLRNSNFGTPNSKYVTANGNIGSTDYLQQASLVASNFDDTLLPQEAGDVAYIAEMFFATPDLGFLTAAGVGATNGSYSRAIF